MKFMFYSDGAGLERRFSSMPPQSLVSDKVGVLWICGVEGLRCATLWAPYAGHYFILLLKINRIHPMGASASGGDCIMLARKAEVQMIKCLYNACMHTHMHTYVVCVCMCR
jgi:hypothetical protein